MPRFRPGFAPVLSCALAALLGLSGLQGACAAQAEGSRKPVRASISQFQENAYDEIARLLGAGLTSEARQRIETLLAQRPQDPQLRFLRGALESQQGQSAEALATYTALTQDYPELPEPYNNLAVLYATQGRLDEARTALETALRLNPGYATAHQNLGDIYAQLAKLAWTRALELDPANPALRPRLQILNQLPAAATAR